jgi:arylsulfatase
MACSGQPTGDVGELSALLPELPDANVIVISFDALRPDALGAYGYPLDTSPNLDAFADHSLVFENAWSVAPKTPTSFAGVFTARYPTRVFRDWRLVSQQTLAGLFASAGYRTAAFVNSPQLAPRRGFAKGFERYRMYRGRGDARVVRDAVLWLSQNRDEKFLLWIHLIDPHSPWDWRPTAEHLYRDDYVGRFERRAANLMWLDDADELAHVRELYDGEIHAADALFGSLLDRVEALGLDSNTIVVVTSDHGEEFMEHGHLQHGYLNEENLRIPLLIRHPKGASGERVPVRVSNLDLMPTLAALVGIETDLNLDGRNLLAAEAPDRVLISVANTEAKLRAVSILAGDSKLVVHCGKRRDRELYDLSSDPGEKINRVGETSEQADALEARLWAELGLSGCADLAIATAEGGEAETRGLAPEVIEALEELGYLEE